MVYLKLTKWRPLQWCPFLSFYSIRRESRYKRERLNIPFIQWGILAWILWGEIDGALTPTPLTHYHAHYSPRTPMYPSLSHVDVHISAHHTYTLGILWCISSTLQFTFVLINILQLHHVRVQRCTPRFCSLCSVFPLWTKIFTTLY